MSVRSFCPECGTILRIRDRSFVGRRVNCPECRADLKVEKGQGETDYVMRKIAAKSAPHPSPLPSVLGKNQKSEVRKPESLISRITHSPWTVASLIGLAMILLISVLFLNRQPPVAEPISSTEADPAGTTTIEPVIPINVETPVESMVVNQVPGSSGTLPEEWEPVSAIQPENVDEPLTFPVVVQTSIEETVGPEVAPEPPPIDVEAKMKQRLITYKQPAVARQKLLTALEEQLGVAIRYDSNELGAAELEKAVSFELHNTTIGDVIQFVAREAQWEIVIEPTGIRLIRNHSK